MRNVGGIAQTEAQKSSDLDVYKRQGRQYAIWYNAEGIRIAQGESAQRSSATLIPWEQAAARIRELLDLGRYMPCLLYTSRCV